MALGSRRWRPRWFFGWLLVLAAALTWLGTGIGEAITDPVQEPAVPAGVRAGHLVFGSTPEVVYSVRPDLKIGRSLAGALGLAPFLGAGGSRKMGPLIEAQAAGPGEEPSWPAQAGVVGPWIDNEWLLARLVEAEAEGEPYPGRVGVAAVILNRVKSPAFPSTIPEVVYQPFAFESVMNGRIWEVNLSSDALNAARDALNGWDPTYGSLFFWNPAKPVSAWIWTRTLITQIGSHVFAL